MPIYEGSTALDYKKLRLGGYIVSAESIADLFLQDNSTKSFKVTDGPPGDAKFCGAWWDPMRRIFLLVYEHRSFPTKEPFDQIEFRNIEMTIVRGDKNAHL